MFRLKKIVSTFITLALVLPALAILAWGPRASTSLPKDRVIVEYWEKWAGAEETHMRDIVDRFNATVGKEKGIFVRYTSTSGVAQKTLVAIAGGVPPDIAGLWHYNVSQYAAMDALENLDDLARRAGINETTYKPGFWQMCNYRGHLYALVSTPATVALYYNKKAFQTRAAELRAAGLDPDRAPRTLDELDRYADVLTELAPNGRIIRAGFLPMEPGWYMTTMYIWFGGDIWDARTQRFTLTDPKVVQSMEWIQKYASKYGSQATNEFRSGVGNFDSPQNAFLAGTVTMVQQGPWLSDFIDRLKPDMTQLRWPRAEEFNKSPEERRTNYAWVAAPFPGLTADQNNISPATADVLVIPRGAKHVAESFEFLAFMTRQDNMERLCQLHATHSPLAKVSEAFVRTHPNPYISVFEDLARSPNLRPPIPIPIWPEVDAEMNNLVQSIVLLQDKPLPALQAAQERMQAKYDEFAAKQKAREAQAVANSLEAKPTGGGHHASGF